MKNDEEVKPSTLSDLRKKTTKLFLVVSFITDFNCDFDITCRKISHRIICKKVSLS